MLESKAAIERVLRALAERLDLARTPPVELAVCGGAALHIRGLAAHGVTKDVDAFALVRRRGRRKVLHKATPLPPFLLREAAVVARDFDLDPDWLNSGPADLLDFGLPKGWRAACVRSGTVGVSRFTSWAAGIRFTSSSTRPRTELPGDATSPTSSP